MPYSYKGGEEKTARAYGKDINISRKSANEVCAAIRGMKLNNALAYLEKVLKHEEYIPFRRHIKKLPHRKKGAAGRYVTKSVKKTIAILQNASANAEYKGLDPERLRIVHSTAYKGITLERTKPKGRAHPSNIELTNIEIVVKEE